MGRIVIAALLMLVAGDDAIADDQRFGPPIQLQPSLTCAGKLITTTDKNTSDEAVRDFSVVVDFSKARGATIRLSQGKLVVDYSEARAPSVELSQGDAERLSANINSIDSLDILFSDSTSWEKDGKVARELGVGTGTVQRIKEEMTGPFAVAAA